MTGKVIRGIVLLVGGTSATILGSILGAVPSRAGATDWFAQASPQLTFVRQLPSNVTPVNRSVSCSWIVYFPKNILTPATDCVAETSGGYLSGLGNGLMVDDKTFVPIMPTNGRAIYKPLPNSPKIMATYYSTVTNWEYLGFYNNLRRADLQDKSIWCGFSCTERQLQIDKLPDFYVSDSDSKALQVNVADIAFSPNGNWLVVDSPSGLLRVNLQDGAHEVLPFARSLAQLPYAGQSFIQLAVSDDGRYVVAAQTVRVSNVSPNLWLYDLGGCTGKSITGAQSIAEGCRVRDLWNGLHATNSHSSDMGLSNIFNNPASIVNPQLVGNDSLSFDITYNKSGSSFDAGSYVLTAPGGSLHNLGLLGVGDSYISGEGEFKYAKNTDSDNNRCHQSLLSYPFLLGAKSFNSYDSIACSGAVTDDIVNDNPDYIGQVFDKLKQKDRDIQQILDNMLPGYLNQNQFVSFYQPEAILLSVGGNDIGFGDIVGSCVSGVQLPTLVNPTAMDTTCYPTYEDRLELMQEINRSFNKLVSTYQSILAASPASRLYVVGYPQIAKPGGSCGLNVHLDADEVQFSMDAINYLNSVIRQAAANAGVYYVDVSHALDGHELCESGDKAVNGLTEGNDQFPLIGHESYHPTVLGHQLLAAAIDSETSGLTVSMPAAQPTLGPPVISDNDPLLVHASQGKSGRTTNRVTHTNDASESIWERGKDIFVSTSGIFANFASNTPVAAWLHSDPLHLGTFTTDANGDLQGAFTLPADAPSGVHVLHLQGKDMGGNDVDIEQTVYIAVSPDDYDGDGIANALDSCVYVANSGNDVDRDGIDDACDAEITNPPAVNEGDSGNVGDTTATAKGDQGEVATATLISPISLQSAAINDRLLDTTEGISMSTASNGSVLGESVNPESAITVPSPGREPTRVLKPYVVSVVACLGLFVVLAGGFFAWLLRRRQG